MSVPTEEISPADAQATFCATVVDEWARAGMTEAVVSPGSRSTPIVMALARDRRIRVHVRLDERSAGFFALGLALATARPVAVCTTSGTAAAELHPAVVEAHHSCVPLVLCTADRPPLEHGIGTPQTIDQADVFGRALRWRLDPGMTSWRARGAWRSIAARCIAEALHGPMGPGPVHLNLPFDEPLLGSALQLPPGRSDGAPWHAIVRSEGSASRSAWQPSGGRVLVVAGSGAGSPSAVLGAAEALGAPVLADPMSGCRFQRTGIVAASDAILRCEVAASVLRPDVVVRLGSPHASKVLAARLHQWANEGTMQMIVDDRWRWLDPDRDVNTVVRADPSWWCEWLTARLEHARSFEPDLSWHGLWSLAESEAQQAVSTWCGEHPEATEPGVGRSIAAAVPRGTMMFVASSMPVRDLEWYGPALDHPPRVIANRGANGIDGTVSTAMGVAASGHGVVAVVGDLAFLHDLTALVAPPSEQRAPTRLTIVVVDNSGGGIFSFLPQRSGLDDSTFERLFATAQGSDVAQVARGLGLVATEVSTIAHLEQALRDSVLAGPSGPASVVRVRVPGRDLNVDHHAEINSMVEKRVSEALLTARR